MTYDEFRVVVTPATDHSGVWTIRLEDCPLKEFIGQSQTILPSIDMTHLSKLRNPTRWPNILELRSIGHKVWQSIMSPMGAVFKASWAVARQNGRGLRIVMVRHGSETEIRTQNGIGLAELPIELLCDPDTDDFIATNELTPVSRGLQVRADRPAYRIDLPIRILVVVAKPSDKPPADADNEAAAIAKVLAPLGPDVELHICDGGTYQTFLKELQTKHPHIVHFVGHGAYSRVGDDLTPRPYLCFVRPDNGLTWYVDAETLNMDLRNTDVRLVILTACSSAAPLPFGERYDPSALEGTAQRLVLGNSGVSAAVAMQFDFEALAAVEFSRALYGRLLEPDCSLDEAVTWARKAVASNLPNFGLGHRAWVTPTVYWRCIDGKVFQIEKLRHTETATLQELQALDGKFDAFVVTLADISREAQPLIPLIQRLGNEVASIQRRRSELLNQTLRLSVQMAPAGRINLSILLRLRCKGPVDLVRFKLQLPPELTLVTTVKSAECPTSPAVTPVINNVVDVFINRPWDDAYHDDSGERDIGAITLLTKPDQPPGQLTVSVIEPEILHNGEWIRLRTLDGIIFVHR